MKVAEWGEAYNQPASRESGTSMYLKLENSLFQWPCSIAM